MDHSPNVTNNFTHDGKLYSLDIVRHLVQKEAAHFVPIDKLLWVLKYDEPDEDRVFHAKLRYPLLVHRQGDRYTVVDGLHRLERYRRRGIGVVPVKFISDDVLAKALIK